MDWTLTHFWLILGLILLLSELLSGVLVLLAVGLAALLTAVVAALGGDFIWQLTAMGLFSGILIPVMIYVIRPRFSPRGVAYGATGSGGETGETFPIEVRDRDGALGIRVKGDFLRVRGRAGELPALAPGDPVVLEGFEGTTALVYPLSQHKGD